MNTLDKKATAYCDHMQFVCGASCSLLTSRNVTEWVCAREAPFCRGCGGCDYVNTFHYGCSEAYRWSGKYVFYCPRGLGFVAASLTDEQGLLCGGMLLGPLSIGSLEDTLATIQDPAFSQKVSALPVWDTKRVHHTEEILRAVAASVSGAPQSRYGSIILEQEKLLSRLYEMKSEWQDQANDSSFLIQSEKQMSRLVANRDKDGAQRLLNEMLGYIFFTGQADLFTIKARLVEMLVLLSRSAIDAGAGIQEILLFNEESLRQMEEFSGIEDMSMWITVIMHRFINYSFDFASVKHADMLYKVMQYIKANYDKKITLDDIAKKVLLSRSYVSSVFKEETGESLTGYINRVRVEKSKVLLLNEGISLVNIGALCGFDDQSYFTKVFKSIVGISPKKYRDCRGKFSSPADKTEAKRRRGTAK